MEEAPKDPSLIKEKDRVNFLALFLLKNVLLKERPS